MDLLTIAIVTYNEEENISECITSFRGIANRILVIDNYSTDNTASIAEALGAEVVKSKLHVRERIKWVLSDGIVSSKWILFIDADERMTEESSKEFKHLCEKYANNEKVNGIVVRYRNHFMGKDLHHGGFSPLRKLRAFKPGTAYYETMDVDEHYVLFQGEMVYMKTDFLHLDYKGLRHWVDKHTIYAQRSAIDYKKKILLNETINYHGLEFEAKIKRFLKYKVYYKLPSGLRAWLFYVYCYYIRLGFLDGKEGKLYAFLHSYWYRYLVDIFIYENELKEVETKQ